MTYKRENLKNESNERPESNVYDIRTISIPTVLITISFAILDGKTLFTCERKKWKRSVSGFLTWSLNGTSISLRQAIYYSQQTLETLTVK